MRCSRNLQIFDLLLGEMFFGSNKVFWISDTTWSKTVKMPFLPARCQITIVVLDAQNPWQESRLRKSYSMQISLFNDLELSTTVLSCSVASSVYSTSLIWAIPLGQSPDFGQTEDRVDLKKIWFLKLLDQWIAHLELVKNLSNENGKTAGHETPWNCLMTKVELYMLKVQMCINKSNVQLSFFSWRGEER